MVPNVRPVLMSRVVYVACGRNQRSDAGYTPTNFAAIVTRKNAARRGSAPASAPRLTFIPPLRKKNGVRSEKATTRKRFCCSRPLDLWLDDPVAVPPEEPRL
jgi:hypothetical protein